MAIDTTTIIRIGYYGTGAIFWIWVFSMACIAERQSIKPESVSQAFGFVFAMALLLTMWPIAVFCWAKDALSNKSRG